ncbi:Avirulence (Avh) protein [Phytophthora megakarya]|uniref:Avirulence (Avh) protein n=1 Tax=Phytophthora megakarya TaxID=4795 RepID=A0A225V1Z4_9STRA|nr:Avirulence (Avh) protein [Phytophthora megakarya]
MNHNQSPGYKNDNINQVLRGPERNSLDRDATDEDSVREERGFLFEKVSNIFASLTKLDPRLKTVNDLDQWIKTSTTNWYLKAQVNQLYRKLYKEFENIKVLGWNPKLLKEELGISKKIETMSHSQLMQDDNYMLWIKFTEFWISRKF